MANRKRTTFERINLDRLLRGPRASKGRSPGMIPTSHPQTMAPEGREGMGLDRRSSNKQAGSGRSAYID